MVHEHFSPTVTPNAPLEWFVNISTDFSASLPQIRFLSAPISMRIFINHPKGSLGGSGSRETNQSFLQCTLSLVEWGVRQCACAATIGSFPHLWTGSHGTAGGHRHSWWYRYGGDAATHISERRSNFNQISNNTYLISVYVRLDNNIKYQSRWHK